MIKIIFIFAAIIGAIGAHILAVGYISASELPLVAVVILIGFKVVMHIGAFRRFHIGRPTQEKDRTHTT